MHRLAVALFLTLGAFAQDCSLIIPANPLSAAGLATPYQLMATNPKTGPCNQANADQSAFVQAAILSPKTGQVSVYSPLVVDKGTQPAASPVKPKLPDDAIVAIWFGFNGANLTLVETDSNGHDHTHEDEDDEQEDGTGANCVNGSHNSIFGQFAYCNAPAFFKAANKAIKDRKLVVPPLGAGSDGRTCPTSRDFAVIDQDPSDNVTTNYLNINGRFAQATAANLLRFPSAVKFGNPSDERLVTALLDPALGCQPWTAPDLADAGAPVTALALNELQADAYQLPPVALIPLLDPMVLVRAQPNLHKLNLYRKGVDQPTVDKASNADPVLYCQDLARIGAGKLALDRTIFTARPSPFPGQANSLFTFLAMRFVTSYGILNCQPLLHAPSPVTLTTDAQGVVTAAEIRP